MLTTRNDRLSHWLLAVFVTLCLVCGGYFLLSGGGPALDHLTLSIHIPMLLGLAVAFRNLNLALLPGLGLVFAFAVVAALVWALLAPRVVDSLTEAPLSLSPSALVFFFEGLGFLMAVRCVTVAISRAR
jgi:cation transport ATPase